MGRLGINAREFTQARELTINLVRRDLKARHRGTFLGMLWSLANPLLLVGMYYVIFRYILQASPIQGVSRPDGNPIPFAVYFFAGLTLWNLFSNSAVAATTSVVAAAPLLHKVYFPRAILPLSTVLSSLITFAFELLVLVAITLVFVGPPGLSILWVPTIVLIVIMFTFGSALLLSATTVFLRDIEHFIGIMLQLWFWATPIIYSLALVDNHPGVRRALELNPMTGVVIGFRNVIVLDRAPDLGLLAYDLAWAVALLVVGFYLFRRLQRLFPEIV